MSLDVCFKKRSYRVGGQGDDDQTMLCEKLQTPKEQKYHGLFYLVQY